MSVNSWHDSDDVDSEEESAAYNLLYKNNQCENEKKTEIISNNIENLLNIERNINNIEEKNTSENNIVIISDSDDSFVAKKIVCKNKVSTLYVGSNSDYSEDSFFCEKISKNEINLSTEIIVNVNDDSLMDEDSENILNNLMEIRNNLNVADWTVDNIDLQSKQRSRNRYFEESKSNICDICQKKGHARFECSRSGPVCILCGKEGHISSNCDDMICHICFQIDHITKKCTNSSNFLKHPCSRCGQRGHSDQICPDLWRQYKYTLRQGCPIIQSCSSQTKKNVFCANCSRPGHFTEECQRNRMSSKFIGPAPIMEIVRFDTMDIYQNYKLSYTNCEYNLNKNLTESTDSVDPIIMNIDVTRLVEEEEIKKVVNIDNQNGDFGDGYIMLSPIAKTPLSKRNKKAQQQINNNNIQCSTPVSLLRSLPLKINGDIIDSSMPSLPESLLKTLFPEETKDIEKLSPSLRAKLRKRLKNLLKNGYLPGDSQMTQNRMEFWLQDISTGKNLTYKEKRKLLGSVSAALHSISDRVSNVTTDSEVKELSNDKPFVINRDIAESRKKRNKNNRQKKSLQNEIKELQKDNKDVSIDLTLDDDEEKPLKTRLRKRKSRNAGSLSRKKRQMTVKNDHFSDDVVIESVY